MSTESARSEASERSTSAALASSAGIASSSVLATVIRSGASMASSGPKPTSVICIRSDQRLVASSTAIAASTACTMRRDPRTAISPCATSRSTSIRPVSLVPIETRPG